MFTLVRLGVAGFLQVRKGDLWRGYGSPGSFGFARVHWGAHMDRGGHSGSPAFNQERIGVARFIPVHFGLLRANSGRRVHSR